MINKLDYNSLYFIGICFTVLIAGVNLYLTIRNNKRSIFTNSITSSRIKYIQDIRNSISEFCGLINTYNLKDYGLDQKDLYELHKQADKVKYLIRLYLNPEDKYWDTIIMNLIDEILLLTDKNPEEKINQLITVTQYLLKLEWERAKLESEKGILSKKKNKTLYLEYKNKYEMHLKSIKTN